MASDGARLIALRRFLIDTATLVDCLLNASVHTGGKALHLQMSRCLGDPEPSVSMDLKSFVDTNFDFFTRQDHDMDSRMHVIKALSEPVH